MTKSLYKVSLSGEVGGAEAVARTGTGVERGRMRVEGQLIEQRREEAVSAGLSRWRRNQRWEWKAGSDSDKRMRERGGGGERGGVT